MELQKVISLDPVPAEQLARIERLGALTIASQEQELEAVDGLSFIQSVRRSLEKARKDLVGPLNDRVKAVNDGFRRLSDPIEKAEASVKSSLLSWRQAEAKRIADEQVRIARENAEREARAKQEEERLRKEKEEAARKEAEEAGLSTEDAAEYGKLEAADVPAAAPLAEVPPPPPPTTVRSTLGAATIRKTWAFEVEDERLIPRAYLQVNETAIRCAVNSGVREIPGIRIFERESIAGGRAR